MGTYIIDQRRTVIHIGDIHGNFYVIEGAIKMKRITHSLLIQHGDFGIGFHKKNYYDTELSHLSRLLVKTNNLLYVIRGNHDDPSYFTGEYRFPNLYLIADYSTIFVNEMIILCLGGGISIDRSVRTLGSSYWSDEFCVYNEEKLKALPPINKVVSHDSPGLLGHFYKPGLRLSQWLAVDPGLQHLLEQSNGNLEANLNWLKSHEHPLSTWIMAHFHKSDSFVINGIEFHILGIDEFKFIYND
jgi:hypothetical protein